jgi:hypothetical protein
MARVQVIHETTSGQPGQWRLVFQWCMYVYDDGNHEHGYRFIWRRDDGSLQAARGQARLPSSKAIKELVQKAKDEGWGDLVGD